MFPRNNEATRVGASELEPVPNFRVFNEDGYGSSVGVEHSSLPFVVYALVSLFTSSFSKDFNVKHMVQQTDAFFSDQCTVTPMFYINTRTLQEITEPVLFPVTSQAAKVRRINSGPLYNAERRWLGHFEAAERSQYQAEISIVRHILPWSVFLRESGPYASIYTFIRKLFFREEGFSSQFYDDISEVVSLFVEHNVKKFKKNSGEVTISESDVQLLHEYLAQEFSVFLVLASLNTMQLLKETYTDTGANISVSISEHTPVQPILTYPISAAGELAEKTFDLFVRIQTYYITECQRQNLPRIETPLIIVDSLISNYNKAQLETSLPSSEAASVNPISPTQESTGTELSSLLPDGRELSPTGIEATALLNYSGATQAPVYFKRSEVERITNKIMGIILNHQNTGEGGLKLTHKKGITFDISVKDKVENAGLPTAEKPKSQAKALREKINRYIESILESGAEVNYSFIFSGYRFTFQASNPSSEAAVVLK